MFSEAKKLKQQGPEFKKIRKKYYRVSPEVRKEIIEFYLDDNNSVKCSGMRELTKINLEDKSTTKKAKRILLYDLKVLYNDWTKITNVTKIPCFAFFCQLMPDECVFAGDPGIHNICICDRHQNLKLKLSAVKVKIDYREVIAAGVCSVNNKSCMLYKCATCLGKTEIRGFLMSQIKIRDDKLVKYSNWINIATTNTENSSNTRMTVKKFEVPFSEFIDGLIEDLWVIRKHHFIAHEQKKYYSECKKNLNRDTGILGMDFAENYPFVCQDSSQGFYFNNSQASLFTPSLNYGNQIDNEVHVASYCVIFNSMKHQAFSLHISLEAVIERIKKEFPWIKKLIYFSDRAPTQFKNKNNFINICHHEEDFGIKVVSYNFFATSHGKSACDGIGAVAKGTARKASLQKVRILDAKEMYDYLNEKESSIRFCYVPEKEVQDREKRFKSANNTREYHFFEPINKNQMVVRLYSCDTYVQVMNIT